MPGRHHSYRCGYCDLNWPLQLYYRRCPACTTMLVPHKAKAMSDQAAINVVTAFKRKAESGFYAIIANAGFDIDERRTIAEVETEMHRQS